MCTVVYLYIRFFFTMLFWDVIYLVNFPFCPTDMALMVTFNTERSGKTFNLNYIH